MSEKQLENQVLQALNMRGVFCFKIQSTGLFDPTKKIFRKSMNQWHIKGVSDILGIYNGRMIAIELKRPLKNPRTKERLDRLASPDQISFINRVNAEGGIGFVADSLDYIFDYLNL